MERYNYRPLDDPQNDIRVPAPCRPPVDIEAIRASLPPGWDVWETQEDEDHRVIFRDFRQTTSDDPLTNCKTSWDHPDPSFDKSVYELVDMTPLDASFKALSYGSSSSTLPITRNLASAIRHLRSSDKPRTMWIDAIVLIRRAQQKGLESSDGLRK
ncbi:hypothetical protein K458DRAFT_395923 [Lentithecium fluviatile CBS 122367]|uniref:Heterokaryon incompatibility domain-containing protein n=1 Tax=Lentithecium fluviatile CBS 122367 TaxID=1168545 RepID=A0A6G1IGS1_9PLEO|nr:hypothetical protein K458DRAFT_395923 [Lentithecium fluviatile CBS 122367]